MSRDVNNRAGGAFVPIGRLLRFPDLAVLRPIARVSVQERIEARLAAFYDAVDELITDAPRPYTTDIWVNPSDEHTLRRWVEAPAGDDPTEAVRRFTAWHWTVIGPSVSEQVPAGHLIVTPRGTSKRVRP